MPYKNKTLKCWVGQVKMTVEGDEYQFLSDRPYWKKTGQNQFKYRRDKTRQDKKKFTTKRMARAWEKEHEQKVRSSLTAATHITFSVYSTEYLKQIEVTCSGDNTFGYKKKLISDILQFYQADPILPLSPLDIESFLVQKAKTDGPKNANRAKRELGTLFNWMIQKGIIHDNPVKTVKKFPVKKFKKYVPPKNHILQIIASANAEDKDILRTALHSMARAGEIRRMQISHCDFKNNTVTLYTRKTEDGSLEGGKIPMNKILREILYRRCQYGTSQYVFPNRDGEQLSKNTLKNLMPRLFKRINNTKEDVQVEYTRQTKTGPVTQKGWRVKWVPKPEKEQIKPFGLHAIRHHVAAHLYLNEGYRVGELQKLLRHKKPTTTEAYLESILDLDAPVGMNVLDNYEDQKEEASKSNVKLFKEG